LGMFLAKLCGEDKPSGIAEWVALRGKWIASLLEPVCKIRKEEN
jgi:hypothetical protein